MSLLLIFTLGYAIGGVSALLLFGLMRAARNGDRQVRGVIIHDT
jgi:hypothetical protein